MAVAKTNEVPTLDIAWLCLQPVSACGEGGCVTNNVTEAEEVGTQVIGCGSQMRRAGVVPGNHKPASRILMQKGLSGLGGDNLTLLHWE